jgi:superfamily I DNA/RNA helicase
MKQQTTLSKPTYWATKEDLFLKINTVVLDLLNKGVHLKMISILTEENNIPGIIAMNHKLFTTWNQQNKFVFPEDKILVMTPEDFKGMENNVIIFTGTQDYNPHETINRSLWHVAFTRAKDNLILLLNEQFKTALTSEYFKNNPI